jgi:hypothetical protein
VTERSTPQLVVAVERALGKKVVALRYLPSPAASAEAAAHSPSGGPDRPLRLEAPTTRDQTTPE